MNMIHVYSTQGQKMIDLVHRDGYITGGTDHTCLNWYCHGEDYGLIPQYNWMREQMKRRLSHYNWNYPIWVWLNEEDVDMTQAEYLLHAYVPKERVLYSLLEGWNHVIGNMYYCRTEEESEKFDRLEIDECERQRIKEKSWEKIFDNSEFISNEWLVDIRIQGCIEYIYMDEIIDIKKL